MTKCKWCSHPQCSGAHTAQALREFTDVTSLLRLGWSQAAIAQKLRLSRGYVASIHKGWANASLCYQCGVAFFPKRTGQRKQRFDSMRCAHAFARGEVSSALE